MELPGLKSLCIGGTLLLLPLLSSGQLVQEMTTYVNATLAGGVVPRNPTGPPTYIPSSYLNIDNILIIDEDFTIAPGHNNCAPGYLFSTVKSSTQNFPVAPSGPRVTYSPSLDGTRAGGIDSVAGRTVRMIINGRSPCFHPDNAPGSGANQVGPYDYFTPAGFAPGVAWHDGVTPNVYWEYPGTITYPDSVSFATNFDPTCPGTEPLVVEYSLDVRMPVIIPPFNTYYNKTLNQIVRILYWTSQQPPGEKSYFAYEAVMVNNVQDQLVGTFETPPTPWLILRDPPGDGSTTEFISDSTVSYGKSYQAGAGSASSSSATVSAGGSGGFFGIGASATVSGTTTESLEATNSASEEVINSYSTTSTFGTANDGDVFVGANTLYDYGYRTIVKRTGGCSFTESVRLGINPVGASNNFTYSENYIRGSIIPDLITDTIGLSATDPLLFKEKKNELQGWRNMLQMNETLKQQAIASQNPPTTSWNAGIVQSYSETNTTTESIALEQTVILSNGVSGTAGLDLSYGWATVGASAGEEMTFTQNYGTGANQDASTTYTNYMSFADDDADDAFRVKVYKDKKMGGFVFGPLLADTETSCPYEGGLQRDQPELLVNGATSALQNEVVGNFATFNVSLTNNNATEGRDYRYFVNQGSNSSGANVTGGYGITTPPPNAIIFTALEVKTGLITIEKPVGLDEVVNLRVFLEDDCGDGEIRSIITLSAYFGAGNFGPEPPAAQCIPDSSTYGTTDGDFIDGVTLGNINNTGTGGVGEPTYTDYSDAHSTTLIQGSSHTITITSGFYPGDAYFAWIDYDNNGTFDPSELLGSASNSSPLEQLTITFTVPLSATYANTILRVRGAYANPPFNPCTSYDYGETEDYGILIEQAMSTGIAADQLSSFKLYPVPANDQLRVEFNKDGRYDLEVLDLSGRTLQQLSVTGPSSVLDITDLADGQYLLRAHSEEFTNTKPFIVLH